MDFLDCLCAAIDASPSLTADSEIAVGMDLAVQNANDTCKYIIAGLAKTASLAIMIEACTQAPWIKEQQKVSTHTRAQASALAVTLKPLIKEGKGDQGRPHSRESPACFQCRQLGHTKRDYPQKVSPAIKNHQAGNSIPFCRTCIKCNKFRH